MVRPLDKRIARTHVLLMLDTPTAADLARAIADMRRPQAYSGERFDQMQHAASLRCAADGHEHPGYCAASVAWVSAQEETR